MPGVAISQGMQRWSALPHVRKLPVEQVAEQPELNRASCFMAALLALGSSALLAPRQDAAKSFRPRPALALQPLRRLQPRPPRTTALPPCASVGPLIVRSIGPIGRLVARVLGVNFLRSARSALQGRATPYVLAGLAIYSVAVTLYAAQATKAVSSASAGGSLTGSTSGEESTAQQSLAEAAVAAQATALPLEQPQVKAAATAAKKDDRVVCKVCGGSGQVRGRAEPG